MVSDDWDDVSISTYIDFVEKLVGIAFAVVLFQHLNEIAAFNQRDDLFEADSALPDEPGVLVWIERIVLFLHIRNVYDDVCLLSTERPSHGMRDGAG